jgi:deoxycytidylate deaminase
MRILTGEEESEGKKFMEKCAELALTSGCHRSRCGAVIVKGGKIIGEGWNAPPLNEKIERCKKDALPDSFKSDKTCCLHAEERAILHCLRKHGEKILGSRLYFVRIDDFTGIEKAGKPYCTICSKLALDAGVKEFVLWHEEGITVYETHDYNERSFAFRQASQ